MKKAPHCNCTSCTKYKNSRMTNELLNKSLHSTRCHVASSYSMIHAGKYNWRTSNTYDSISPSHVDCLKRVSCTFYRKSIFVLLLLCSKNITSQASYCISGNSIVVVVILPYVIISSLPTIAVTNQALQYLRV